MVIFIRIFHCRDLNSVSMPGLVAEIIAILPRQAAKRLKCSRLMPI